MCVRARVCVLWGWGQLSAPLLPYVVFLEGESLRGRLPQVSICAHPSQWPGRVRSGQHVVSCYFRGGEGPGIISVSPVANGL